MSLFASALPYSQSCSGVMQGEEHSDPTTTMEASLNTKRRLYTAKTILYICGMSWASFAYGYVASVISITLGQSSFLEYMGLLTAKNANGLISAITCLFYAGGCFGSLAAAPMSDRSGRKPTIFVVSLITLIATALLAGSVNPAMFIVFRFVTGFGSTIVLAAVPVWITEIVPSKDRGLLIEADWVTIGFTMNTLAITIVERILRPYLTLCSFLGCLGSLIGGTVIQAKYLGITNKSALAGGVAMPYTFVFFYTFFLDGSTSFYIGEIFPNHLRAKDMTLAMLVLNLANVVWQSAALTGFARIGWRFYLFFIAFAAMACVVVPFTFPDMRNKSLEEIGRLLGDEDLMVDNVQTPSEGNTVSTEDDTEKIAAHVEWLA